jgi:hypothetical protein
MALEPASNTVLLVASAHAVRASLFASAHPVGESPPLVLKALYVRSGALHQQTPQILVATFANA